MKKLNQYIISIFLIALLINTAYGYPGMAGNISSNRSTALPDLNNATQSDQEIQLLQQLIEVDAVQFQSENRLYVRETLIFKNTGEKNFSGTLRTWVPDGVEGTKIERRSMVDGSLEYAPQTIQNGNIISWQDIIYTQALPPMYAIEYVLPAEAKGTITKTKYYSKKLLYPTLISKVPGNLIIKVTKNNEEIVTVTDEKGNNIGASGSPREDENSVLYGWSTPQFKELYIEISKPAAAPAGLAGYVILGLLIVLAFSYPILRKKNDKLQAFEEKIRNSLKREPKESSEEIGEESPEEAAEETAEEIPQEPVAAAEEEIAEDAGLSVKTKNELETEKDELLSRLDELKKEYASGNMLDEEYEELRASYETKVEKITKMIERSG